MRFSRPEAVGFLGYLVAQSFVVAGLPTARYPDSAGYFAISFTGVDLRLWTVPLFFNIFPNDATRIAGQVLLAAACWWILAREASALVTHPKVRLGLRVVLLALGLVGPIAQFNSTILSDSVALSLSALLIGCWIRHLARPSWRTAVAVVVTTVVWTFTRNDLVLIGVLVTAIVCVVTAIGGRRTLHVVVAAALVAISAYGLAIDGRNTYVANANIADVLEDRVFYNTAWTTWFIDHGMPTSPAIAATKGGEYGLGLMAIPQFAAWLSARGARTYTEFMLTHPVYTLWDPLPDFTGERASLNYPNTTPYTYTQPNPTPSMISPTLAYGRHRDIFPAIIDATLFEQGQIGDVVLLGAVAFALAVAARRRLGRDRRNAVPLVVAFLTIPQGYLVWLTGGDGETDRHSIVLAATVRIGLWIMLGYALDRLLSARSPSPTDAEVLPSPNPS